MKVGFSIRARLIVTVLIAFVLLSSPAAAVAETPLPISETVRRLKAAPNYSWTTTTDFPDAPFKASTIVGMADTNGFVVFKSEVGKMIAIVKGEIRVLKTSSGWKTATPARAKDPEDLYLLNSMTPRDELASLALKLSDIKAIGENSFVGALDGTTAKTY